MQRQSHQSMEVMVALLIVTKFPHMLYNDSVTWRV